MRKLTLAALLVLAACSKSPSTTAPPAAAVPTPSAPAAPRAGAVDVKKLVLDEAKLVGYFTYQTEMAPLSKDAMGMGTAAFAGGARTGEQMGEAMAKDERATKFKEASEAAFKKAGLSLEEVSAIAGAVSEYGTTLWMLRDAEKRAGEKKDTDAMVQAYRKANEDAKAKYVAQYGQAALDLADKHEAEMTSAIEATMAGAFGKK